MIVMTTSNSTSVKPHLGGRHFLSTDDTEGTDGRRLSVSIFDICGLIGFVIAVGSTITAGRRRQVS